MAELVSIAEAGKALSLSPWTLRAHLRRGTIIPVRCGRRVLISQAEIQRIAREGLPSLQPSRGRDKDSQTGQAAHAKKGPLAENK